MARNVSSALTLPEPSQMPISGASRYSRGMPGLLGIPVAAQAFHRLAGVRVARLHTQYLDAASPMRRSGVSRSSPRTAPSVAPAIRIATMVAASASTARSASTLRISGWSIR